MEIANRWFAQNKQPILLSRLSELELLNACRLSVFRKWITLEDCQEVLSNLESDIQAGVLIRHPFSADEIFKLSEHLSAEHTLTTGNRSLDILHVAIAVDARIEVFATFDQRQSVLAKACGLNVVPALCKAG